MAINPIMLMRIRERLSLFNKDHPRVAPFFRMLGNRALMEGTVYELKVTTPDGEEHVANIKLTDNDIESIRMLLNRARNPEE